MAGVAQYVRNALHATAVLPPWLGREVAGIATAAVSNVANNLPVAAFAARTISDAPNHSLSHALLIGIDLGPNLSLSGSLATLLWLASLRRKGIVVTPLQFFYRDAIVLGPALVVALLLVRYPGLTGPKTAVSAECLFSNTSSRTVAAWY